MNFEIRIFANPAGFDEMKLKQPNGKYAILTENLVANCNFDGERGIFPGGTFKIYYIHNAYIIHYILSLPKDESQFRDSEAHIAVALERGYYIDNPLETFAELAKLLTDIVVEYKANEARKHIDLNTENFYRIVNSRIKQDLSQFNINNTHSLVNRAIFAYSEERDKENVLKDPFRSEFKGKDIVYILPIEVARKKADLVNKGYAAVTQIKPKTYILKYPDGHEYEFSDFEQILPEYKIKRPFEKEMIFNGNVKENWENWKIKISEDKTTYIIGLDPEPEIIKFNLKLYDINNNSIQDVQLQVTIGEIIGDEWILRGQEIPQLQSARFLISGYTWKNKLTKQNKTDISLFFAKIYNYNLTPVFKTVKDLGGEDVEIEIWDKKRNKVLGRCNTSTSKFDIEIPYSQILLKIPETLLTEKANVEFDNNGHIRNLDQIQKKRSKELIINVTNDFPNKIKKKIENSHAIGTVKVTYYGKNDSQKQVKEKDITRLPIVLNNLPTTPLCISIKILGYKECILRIDLTSNENTIDCKLKLTNSEKLKRYSFRYLPVIVFGIIMGIVGGFFWGYGINKSNINDLQKQLDDLKVTKDSLQNKIQELDEKLLAEGKDNPYENGNEPPPPDSKNDTYNEHRLTSEQTGLINKLMGNNFTQQDVNKAKKQLKGLNQDALIADAEACIAILNLNRNEKKELGKQGSSVYNQHIKKLSSHNNIMMEIIKSESYQTTGRRDFKTIAELQNYIQTN